MLLQGTIAIVAAPQQHKTARGTCIPARQQTVLLPASTWHSSAVPQHFLGWFRPQSTAKWGKGSKLVFEPMKQAGCGVCSAGLGTHCRAAASVPWDGHRALTGEDGTAFLGVWHPLVCSQQSQSGPGVEQQNMWHVWARAKCCCKVTQEQLVGEPEWPFVCTACTYLANSRCRGSLHLHGCRSCHRRSRCFPWKCGTDL